MILKQIFILTLLLVGLTQIVNADIIIPGTDCKDGYFLSKNVNACIPNNFDESDIRASEIAVKYLNTSDLATIMDIEIFRCDGCFSVTLEIDGELKKIGIAFWEASGFQNINPELKPVVNPTPEPVIQPINEPINNSEIQESKCPVNYYIDATIKACVNQEYTVEELKALQIVINESYNGKIVTILKVETLRCIGCFEVTIEYDGIKTTTSLYDWNVENLGGLPIPELNIFQKITLFFTSLFE